METQGSASLTTLVFSLGNKKLELSSSCPVEMACVLPMPQSPPLPNITHWPRCVSLVTIDIGVRMKVRVNSNLLKPAYTGSRREVDT